MDHFIRSQSSVRCRDNHEAHSSCVRIIHHETMPGSTGERVKMASAQPGAGFRAPDTFFPKNIKKRFACGGFLPPEPTRHERIVSRALELKGEKVLTQFYLPHVRRIGRGNHYDICLPERRLIIEVDGAHHKQDPKQSWADLRRENTAYLHGFRVVHITNRQVEWPAICDRVLNQALERNPKKTHLFVKEPKTVYSPTPLHVRPVEQTGINRVLDRVLAFFDSIPRKIRAVLARITTGILRQTAPAVQNVRANVKSFITREK